MPEDRLRATLFGALVLVPFSVLISGLATQFIPGALGITINVACLFANGVAVRSNSPLFCNRCNLGADNEDISQVDLVLTPSSSYYVDILHSRSAEVWAASS